MSSRAAFRKWRKGGKMKAKFDWGGGGGGQLCACCRGVWGHAPQGKFLKLHALRSILVHFGLLSN